MVKQWEIYYANLNPTRGSEQQGIRPVLIISNNGVNDALSICTVLPLSSYKKGLKIYPSELVISQAITHLDRDSILMFQQIRTISKERLNNKPLSIIVDPETQDKIKEGLLRYFDI